MANTRDGKTFVSEKKIDFGGIVGFGYIQVVPKQLLWLFTMAGLQGDSSRHP